MFRYMTVLFILILAAAECWAVQPYEPVQPDPFLEPWRWQFFDELNGQGLQCLAEDSSGNMWFGIDEGVVRYDGITWTTYRPEDGLHGAPMITLCAGRDGDVFTGTAQGISRFKDGTWQRIFPPEGDMAWRINGLTQTSHGSLWAATRRGPLQLKGETFTLYHPQKTQSVLSDSAAYLRFVSIPEAALPPEGDFPTFDVFEDRDGTIWFSCGVGAGRRGGEIFRCDLQKVLANDPEAWRLYTEADELVPGSGARIIQTRNGVIWSTANSSSSGVNRFDGTA